MIAIVAGSGLALAAAYTNIKRKRLLELLVLLPFIIPSYIITLSWSGFLSGIVNQILEAIGIGPVNIYSIGSILVEIGICNTPIVYMSVIHMLRRIPKDLEWASRACGFGLSYTLIHVDLVQVLPSIIAGGLLAFLSAIDNFSVPAFLGISSGTYDLVRIFTKRQLDLDQMPFLWQLLFLFSYL
ncbi:MAG: ABC transporter permease subunit [Enterocloster sp.]